MKLSEEQKSQLISELKFSASRSSGPGGQNVNKVNTRVELRFQISKSEALTLEERERLLVKIKNRINTESELILTSQSERSQLANKEKVTARFFALIEKTLTISKKRKETVPTTASRLKRLESKKLTGQKKQLRKPPEI